MATTFKVGDKVRALKDCELGNVAVLIKGAEYKIARVDCDTNYVGFSADLAVEHPASEFELVPELPYITFYQPYKVGDRVHYAGEVVSVIDTEADNLWPIRIKYDTGVEGLVSTSELDYWGGKVKYVDPFPEGTRVYVKPGGSNIGDKDGLYVGAGTVEKHWDKITEKTSDRAVRFDSAGVRIYCDVTHIVPIEDAPPTYDFQPGDIVKPKTGNYFGSTIVEYVEDAKAAYPKLNYTGPAVIYKRPQGNGYPSWDRASDVVLYERPVPVVEPERKDWTDLVDRANAVADTVGFVLGEENNVSALIDELIAALIEESYR